MRYFLLAFLGSPPFCKLGFKLFYKFLLQIRLDQGFREGVGRFESESLFTFIFRSVIVFKNDFHLIFFRKFSENFHLILLRKFSVLLISAFSLSLKKVKQLQIVIKYFLNYSLFNFTYRKTNV